MRVAPTLIERCRPLLSTTTPVLLIAIVTKLDPEGRATVPERCALCSAIWRHRVEHSPPRLGMGVGGNMRALTNVSLRSSPDAACKAAPVPP